MREIFLYYSYTISHDKAKVLVSNERILNETGISSLSLFLPPRNSVEETSFVQKSLTKRLRLRTTVEEQLFHKGHFKSRASFAVGARIRHRQQESQ